MIDQFIQVCPETDIPEKGIKTYEVGQRPIALAKFDGVIYAIDNVCTHDEGDLSEGDVVNCQIQCPRHGARFSLKTGEVTRMPAVIGIKTYETKITDGYLYMSIE